MTVRSSVVIGYDGSPAATEGIRSAGELLARRHAVVVVVWKAGLGFEFVESVEGLPPAQLDIRTALEIDRAASENAQRLARRGAGIARDAGFDADGLAIAEDVEVPVSDTLLRVARERRAAAMIVASHGHGTLLGTTVRDVVRHARCPVLVRGPALAARSDATDAAAAAGAPKRSS